MNIMKLTASLLCAALTVPLCGTTVVQAMTDTQDALHTVQYESYEAYASARLHGTVNRMTGASAGERAALPAAYDLRQDGRVTSVKSQGSYGTCWTFAAMHSLESQLAADDPTVDLSEWHLAYYSYSETFGFPLLDVNEGPEGHFECGGNYHILTPMLAGWLGPVSEYRFPYDDWDVLETEKTLAELRAEAEYHVTDAEILYYDLPGEGEFTDVIDAAKQAIYDGHALSLSYYDCDAYHNADTDAYYYADDPAYPSGGEYHAVSVVGWDDNFPASNFNDDPGMDGAWLIKNSWGTNSGDGGYFWMSYAEETVYELFYLKAEDTALHKTNFQYDDYGCTMTLSITDADTSAMMANVFTPQEDTWITDVMFYTSMPDENYEITIYSGLRREDDPSSGKASAVTSGTMANIGYHTVSLTEPVAVAAGEQFAVAVTFSGVPGQHMSCEGAYEERILYPDGSETIDYANMVSTEMIARDFHPGESFYSEDGEEWYDLYEAYIDDATYSYEDENGDTVEITGSTLIGNACIKALAQDAGVVLFSDYSDSLRIGEEITLHTPDGSAVYYAVNGGAYQRYTEPIVLTDAMTITAYAEGYDTVFTQQYAVREAQLTVLGYADEQGRGEFTFRNTAGQTYVTDYICKNGIPETISLMPVTAGTVTCNGVLLPAGELTTLQITEEETTRLVLEVSGEGMLDTRYIIDFREDGSIAYGDTDLDGMITAADASEILIYATAVGADETPVLPDAEWTLRADYNMDGLIDAVDAAEVLVRAAELGAA